MGSDLRLTTAPDVAGEEALQRPLRGEHIAEASFLQRLFCCRQENRPTLRQPDFFEKLVLPDRIELSISPLPIMGSVIS
jgi:hypothetical protein